MNLNHFDYIKTLYTNDGFSSVGDFVKWFNKPFEGQIISWNENIEY